jgi:type II restriction enzyme
MATAKQDLGELGERLTTTRCSCPHCKRSSCLKRLPVNFKCADVICDFCGYLAQVKTSTVADAERVPSRVLGAAWSVQRARMEMGIYFPLFLVLLAGNRDYVIYYLPADLQHPEMFIPRKPLSPGAKRAGWQGFVYDLSSVRERGLVRLTGGRIRAAMR